MSEKSQNSEWDKARVNNQVAWVIDADIPG